MSSVTTSSVTTPFRSALRMLVGYVGATSLGRFAGFVVLVAVEGVLGPVAIAASGLVVARGGPALGAGLGSAEASALAVAIGLAGLAFTAGQVLAPIRSAVAMSIGSRVAQRMREQLLGATLGPRVSLTLRTPRPRRRFDVRVSTSGRIWPR